jgi:hypothetical protein
VPEIQVEFLGHACAAIRCGKTTIVTDPWLQGTAFLGGWQRKYKPPHNWKKILQTADLIYVSHGHSDHLSPDTLIHSGRTPVIVPDFPRRSAELAAARGMVDVTPMMMGQWHQLGDCRIKIIKDECPGHEDSGLVVEYKGKYLVNTVDCTMPGDLPYENVEWLLAPYAGGSSPYPVCYAAMYGSEKTEAIMKRNNDALLAKLQRLIEATHPEKVMPFAGAYIETNEHFRKINLHNQEGDVKADCEVVLPKLELNDSFDETTFQPCEVDPYEYFKGYDWSKRCLIVTQPKIRRIGAFGEPTTIIHPLNMDVWSYALHNKVPMDELAIGYHMLLSRAQDVYESDLWEHFNFRG